MQYDEVSVDYIYFGILSFGHYLASLVFLGNPLPV